MSAAATGVELLPCPFCGGDGHWSPTYIDRDTPGTVECANGCGATVIASGSKAERITAWNTRTGQLVAVQADDAIKRVSIGNLREGIRAIATLKDAQPTQDAKGTGDE